MILDLIKYKKRKTHLFVFAETQLPGKRENQFKEWHSLYQASRRKRLTRAAILIYYKAAFMT